MNDGDAVDVGVKVAELRGEMQSGFARVEGTLGNLANGLDATRREVDQMVRFQSELIKQHDSRLHQLETDRVADRDKAAGDTSAVRVGLEGRLADAVLESRHDRDTLRDDVEDLQRRADRQDGLIKGIGVIAGVVAPVVTTVLIRALS